MFSSAIVLATAIWASVQNGPSDQIQVEDAQVTLIRDVRVPAREAGVLTKLSVKEGDLVKAGAVLGRLDSDLATLSERLATVEHEIAKYQSEGDVDRRYAVKSLAVADSELRRSQDSVQAYRRSVSQTELERLQLVVDKSRLSIEQSGRDLRVAALTTQAKEITIRIAAKHVQQRDVVAPIDGMVVQLFRKPGEWLNEGEPIVRIIKINPLRVEAFVDGSKYGANLYGRPARLTAHLPPGDRVAEFHGRVVFVSPEVQPVNGQVRVWAEVENRDLQLRPGTRGTLTIDLGKPR